MVAWQAAEAAAAVEVSAAIGSVTAGGASDATMGGVGEDNASCSRLSFSGTPCFRRARESASGSRPVTLFRAVLQVATNSWVTLRAALTCELASHMLMSSRCSGRLRTMRVELSRAISIEQRVQSIDRNARASTIT